MKLWQVAEESEGNSPSATVTVAEVAKAAREEEAARGVTEALRKPMLTPVRPADWVHAGALAPLAAGRATR
jgi:hypothetical protein